MLGVRLLTAMRVYWIQKGLTVEAVRRCEAALAGNVPLPQTLAAALWLTLAQARADLFVPSQTLEAAVEAQKLYSALDDQLGMSRALRSKALAKLQLRRLAEAECDISESLALTRKVAGHREIARGLASVAVFLQVSGRLEEARQALSRVVDMAQDGDERLQWLTSINLAEVEFALGESHHAVARAYENLGSDVLRNNARLRSNQESNLAAYLLAVNREKEARAMAAAAICDARDAGDRGMVAIGLQHAAAILARQSAARAAEILGFVDLVLDPTGYHREHTERFTYELLLQTLRANLSEDEIATHADQGALLTEEQAVQLAQRRPISCG